MKTNLHFLLYLAEHFFERQMCQTVFVEKLRTLPPPTSEKRTVYENVKKCRAGQLKMTIWRMRIACWIPKATNTHSGCVILVVFPLQQWLQESASM